MAKKPEITTVASGFLSRDQINTNFTNIRNAFDNTLSLDGSTPNTISANIDMDGSQILNVGAISTVGGSPVSFADLASVSAIGDDVSTVAGISANVTTVAGISADVTSVAGVNSADLAAVAAIDTDVATVASISANVSTVATNVSDVNNFADRYRVSASAPITDNDEGDLYYNTTGNTLNYYDGASWNAISTSSVDVISDLTDVDTTGVADGNVLTYVTANNRWEAAAPASGGTTMPAWTLMAPVTGLGGFAAENTAGYATKGTVWECKSNTTIYQTQCLVDPTATNQVHQGVIWSVDDATGSNPVFVAASTNTQTGTADSRVVNFDFTDTGASLTAGNFYFIGVVRTDSTTGAACYVPSAADSNPLTVSTVGLVKCGSCMYLENSTTPTVTGTPSVAVSITGLAGPHIFLMSHDL